MKGRPPPPPRPGPRLPPPAPTDEAQRPNWGGTPPPSSGARRSYNPDLAQTRVFDPKTSPVLPVAPGSSPGRPRSDEEDPSDNMRTMYRSEDSDMQEKRTVFRDGGGDGDIHEMRTMFQDAGADSESAPLASGPVSGQPVHGAPLGPDAPEWMRLGRIMSSTIEATIARGEATLAERAGVNRAWAAWQMGGYRPKQIGQVARLVDTAWRALRETTRQDHDAVAQDCATIIHSGLPRDMKAWMPADRIVSVVQDLGREPDRVAGRLHGTSKLLGWTEASKAWAAEAIAIALGELA